MARETYIATKQLQLAKRGVGGYALSRKLDKPEWWEAIAKFAILNGLSLEHMIQARFNLAFHKDVVPPMTIPQERYLESYREASELMVEDLHWRLHTEKAVFEERAILLADETGLRGKALYEDVLLETDLNLCPLFRYCLAYSEKLPKVLARYRREATHQYLLVSAGYDEKWANWIPEELRTLAAKFLRAIKGDE